MVIEITKPEPLADGIYFDLPEDAYHADPALGSSDIKNLIISPLQYWAHSHMNPDKVVKEDTDATAFGTWMHEAVFDPGKRTFVAKPSGMSFARKDGKAWRQDQWDVDRTIVTEKQGAAMHMAISALKSSGVSDAIEGAIPEVSYFWTDPSGYRCKIRLDGLGAKQSFDLKMFVNSMGKDLETCIAHAVANYRYHISGFWYGQGIQHMIASLRTSPAIHNATDEHMQVLKSLADNEEHHPYWYLFLQNDGVPNVVVRQFTPKTAGQINAYWRAAKSDIQLATGEYAKNMARFGEDQIWLEEVPWKAFADEEFGAARWILEE